MLRKVIGCRCAAPTAGGMPGGRLARLAVRAPASPVKEDNRRPFERPSFDNVQRTVANGDVGGSEGGLASRS